MHPDGTAHGGSAILIKNNIKHHIENPFKTEQIQATNVVVDWEGPLTISAVYNPPKHNLKKEEYEAFFKSLGHRFLAGGDYNAKHIFWGSRITTPKGRQLQEAVKHLNLNVLSTGEPTYWPTDLNKIPDLIDFCVSKGISNCCIKCESSFDLSSDHSPVIIKLSNKKALTQKTLPCVLHSFKTNWAYFQELVKRSLRKPPLKTNEDIINAVEHFNKVIQESAWEATPLKRTSSNHGSSVTNRSLIAEKRKARKLWQSTRFPEHKKILNRITSQLKMVLKEDRNRGLKNYLESLSGTAATDYSLWKAARKLKRPIIAQPPLRTGNSWAKSNSEKAEAFGRHLLEIFKPNQTEPPQEILDEVSELLKMERPLDSPIKKITKEEVITAIRKLKDNKSPGYDLITATLLKNLPNEGLDFLTQLYNAILLRGYIPPQWKTAQIIMIIKPGKKPEEVASFRPISLLPIASKVLETIFLTRVSPIIIEKKLIPDHQFGFRIGHGTIEQVHRLVEEINLAFERKKYCTTAFLDISQAFDRVWHEGLLYKI